MAKFDHEVGIAFDYNMLALHGMSFLRGGGNINVACGR